MKRKVIGICLLLALFSACQKETDLPEIGAEPSAVGNGLTTDVIHNTLARIVALSLEDVHVRVFLHEEIGREFTGDYDILFDLIKDKEISSGKFGNVSFAAYLESVAAEKGIDFSPVSDYLNKCKNLQISCPVYYNDWDPASTVPLVIGLPMEYNEGERMPVKGYDQGGGENICFEEDITVPILLVRIAERVDEKGMMRVDPDGFVIPEEERIVTAREAYEYTVQHMKSARTQAEPVIEVLDNLEFAERLASRRSIYSYPEGKPSVGSGKILDPGLKSATVTAISAPSTFTVHPAGPYTIQLNWSQVPGAVSYEIYRQYMTYPNYLLATVGADQINYYDQYLILGDNYTYSVRAVDASGNTSPLSNGMESYASWRTNGNRDVIDKIFIDSDCWKWCCGLFDGKIELQYKTSYLTIPGNTNTAYPGVGVNSLGQKTKDQQRNKWCYYNHYLFPWDVRTKSYSYRFVMVEDDGAGDGTTIKFGLTFKVQIFKIVDISAPLSIEFKIADKDESFGEVIIQYWERKNGPDAGSDGYNLMPDRGKARMYIKQ